MFVNTYLLIFKSKYTQVKKNNAKLWRFFRMFYTLHKTCSNEELRMCAARSCYLQVNEISFSG